MKPEDALRQRLATHAPILALVPATRMQPETMAQGAALPYITLDRMQPSERPRHLGGACALVQAQVTVRMYAATKPAADALSELVRLRLDGWGPETVTVGADSLRVEDVALLSDNVQPAEANAGEDSLRMVATHLYRVWHVEASA